MLGGKRVCAVPVGNETEVFRELFQVSECHAHGQDARTDTPVVRSLVTDDGTLRSVHDEPDIAFDATDFNIGFISSKNAAGLIVIMVNKRLYAHGRRLAVIGDLLV